MRAFKIYTTKSCETLMAEISELLRKSDHMTTKFISELVEIVPAGLVAVDDLTNHLFRLCPIADAHPGYICDYAHPMMTAMYDKDYNPRRGKFDEYAMFSLEDIAGLISKFASDVLRVVQSCVLAVHEHDKPDEPHAVLVTAGTLVRLTPDVDCSLPFHSKISMRIITSIGLLRNAALAAGEEQMVTFLNALPDQIIDVKAPVVAIEHKPN